MPDRRFRQVQRLQSEDLPLGQPVVEAEHIGIDVPAARGSGKHYLYIGKNKCKYDIVRTKICVKIKTLVRSKANNEKEIEKKVFCIHL